MLDFFIMSENASKIFLLYCFQTLRNQLAAGLLDFTPKEIATSRYLKHPPLKQNKQEKKEGVQILLQQKHWHNQGEKEPKKREELHHRRFELLYPPNSPSLYRVGRRPVNLRSFTLVKAFLPNTMMQGKDVV